MLIWQTAIYTAGAQNRIFKKHGNTIKKNPGGKIGKSSRKLIQKNLEKESMDVKNLNLSESFTIDLLEVFNNKGGLNNGRKRKY